MTHGSAEPDSEIQTEGLEDKAKSFFEVTDVEYVDRLFRNHPVIDIGPARNYYEESKGDLPGLEDQEQPPEQAYGGPKEVVEGLKSRYSDLEQGIYDGNLIMWSRKGDHVEMDLPETLNDGTFAYFGIPEDIQEIAQEKLIIEGLFHTPGFDVDTFRWRDDLQSTRRIFQVDYQFRDYKESYLGKTNPLSFTSPVSKRNFERGYDSERDFEVSRLIPRPQDHNMIVPTHFRRLILNDMELSYVLEPYLENSDNLATFINTYRPEGLRATELRKLGKVLKDQMQHLHGNRLLARDFNARNVLVEHLEGNIQDFYSTDFNNVIKENEAQPKPIVTHGSRSITDVDLRISGRRYDRAADQFSIASLIAYAATGRPIHDIDFETSSPRIYVSGIPENLWSEEEGLDKKQWNKGIRKAWRKAGLLQRIMTPMHVESMLNATPTRRATKRAEDGSYAFKAMIAAATLTIAASSFFGGPETHINESEAQRYGNVTSNTVEMQVDATAYGKHTVILSKNDYLRANPGDSVKVTARLLERSVPDEFPDVPSLPLRAYIEGTTAESVFRAPQPKFVEPEWFDMPEENIPTIYIPKNHPSGVYNLIVEAMPPTEEARIAFPQYEWDPVSVVTHKKIPIVIGNVAEDQHLRLEEFDQQVINMRGGTSPAITTAMLNRARMDDGIAYSLQLIQENKALNQTSIRKVGNRQAILLGSMIGKVEHGEILRLQAFNEDSSTVALQYMALDPGRNAAIFGDQNDYGGVPSIDYMREVASNFRSLDLHNNR